MMTLIQGTRRPFRVVLTTDGTVAMDAVTAVTLHVHRNYGSDTESIEEWAMTIASGATSTQLTASYAPAATGEGALEVANESLKLRPVLSFASGPDIELPSFLATVEER